MATEVVTTGTLCAGEVQIRRKPDFTAALRRMRDGEVTIRIARHSATRSHPQNRFYWGVVVELLSEHTGYTPDEIHEVLKAKFLPKRVAFSDGNGEVKGEFVIGGTTTTLNKVEFSEYCTRIQEWAAEALDVVIPDPEDV